MWARFHSLLIRMNKLQSWYCLKTLKVFWNKLLNCWIDSLFTCFVRHLWFTVQCYHCAVYIGNSLSTFTENCNEKTLVTWPWRTQFGIYLFDAFNIHSLLFQVTFKHLYNFHNCVYMNLCELVYCILSGTYTSTSPDCRGLSPAGQSLLIRQNPENDTE